MAGSSHLKSMGAVDISNVVAMPRWIALFRCVSVVHSLGRISKTLTTTAALTTVSSNLNRCGWPFYLNSAPGTGIKSAPPGSSRMSLHLWPSTL